MEKMEKLAVLVAQGTTTDIVSCAMKLVNAVFTANSQKMMREKETKSFETEFLTFKTAAGKLNLSLTDSELLELASAIAKLWISSEITTLKL